MSVTAPPTLVTPPSPQNELDRSLPHVRVQARLLPHVPL
jgi:hypothetical protein